MSDLRTHDCFVSVVAPLHDDADIVEAFVDELVGVLRERFGNFEVVLVDDGSADDTWERATSLLPKYEGIRLLRLSRRFGQEIAISAGLESVIGDYIVIMLPDSDPPGAIPEMLEAARQGAGTVVAIRRTRPQGWLTRMAANVFHWYCERYIGLQIAKNSAIFRVLSRQSLNAITQIKDRDRYIRSFLSYVGYGSEEVEYTPISRRGQPERRSFGQSLAVGTTIIFANSAHPLRLASLAGLLVSGLNLLVVGGALILSLLGGGTAPDWASRSIQASSMFFVLFGVLAILSEYVGRMLTQMHDRPLYYVREERHSVAVIVEEERKNVVTASEDDVPAAGR